MSGCGGLRGDEGWVGEGIDVSMVFFEIFETMPSQAPSPEDKILLTQIEEVLE